MERIKEIENKIGVAIKILKDQSCPTILLNLIQDCLQRDPKDRPTAMEIVKRLQPCLKKPVAHKISEIQQKLITQVPLSQCIKFTTWGERALRSKRALIVKHDKNESNHRLNKTW